MRQNGIAGDVEEKSQTGWECDIGGRFQHKKRAGKRGCDRQSGGGERGKRAGMLCRLA